MQEDTQDTPNSITGNQKPNESGDNHRDQQQKRKRPQPIPAETLLRIRKQVEKGADVVSVAQANGLNPKAIWKRIEREDWQTPQRKRRNLTQPPVDEGERHSESGKYCTYLSEPSTVPDLPATLSNFERQLAHALQQRLAQAARNLPEINTWREFATAAGVLNQITKPATVASAESKRPSVLINLGARIRKASGAQVIELEGEAAD